MRRSQVVAAAVVVSLVVVPCQLPAQLTVTGDAGFASAYVWRGITTTNRPVFQPDVLASFAVGPLSILAGGWANVEPVRYDAPTQISQGGGARRADVTEVDAWLEITRAAQSGTFTVGGLQYFFPNAAGVTSTSNTFEIYVKGAFPLPLAPRVALYQDIGKVHGTYVEGAIGHSIPAGRGGAVSLGALVGFSAGERADSLSTDVWYYGRDGISHVDLSATGAWSVGAVAVAPSLHVVLGRDPITRITAPGQTSGAKVWIGTTLSWARTLGGKR